MKVPFSCLKDPFNFLDVFHECQKDLSCKFPVCASDSCYCQIIESVEVAFFFFFFLNWFYFKRTFSAHGSPLLLVIMFEEASEVFENMFKASFPLTFIVLLPAVLFLVSPLPAEAAHEFTVYRMQQYDLQGQAYGKWIQ